jgi:hypothetical protein
LRRAVGRFWSFRAVVKKATRATATTAAVAKVRCAARATTGNK